MTTANITKPFPENKYFFLYSSIGRVNKVFTEILSTAESIKRKPLFLTFLDLNM